MQQMEYFLKLHRHHCGPLLPRLIGTALLLDMLRSHMLPGRQGGEVSLTRCLIASKYSYQYILIHSQIGHSGMKRTISM